MLYATKSVSRQFTPHELVLIIRALVDGDDDDNLIDCLRACARHVLRTQARETGNVG